MKQILLIALSLCMSFALTAQDVYRAKKVNYQSETLDKIFYDYEVYDFNFQELRTDLLKNPNQYYFKLDMGDFSDYLNLYAKDLRANNYKLQVATDDGVKIVESGPNRNFRGWTRSNHSTRITVSDEIFGGSIYYDDYQVFAESMIYLDGDGPRHLTVVYKNTDVRPTPNRKCGFDEVMHQGQIIENQIKEEIKDGRKAAPTCWEFELAVASDGLMTQNYGSVSAVESRNEDVLDDVRPLWNDGQFEEDIEFLLVTQFTSDDPSNDPWTSSRNASTLLSSFRNWGEGGGFGAQYDIACLWTHRDLLGGTIGIAYLSGTCNSAKYHVCEDYGGGSVRIRNLWAHEMGHNFSANHTSGFWIMAPSVNSSSEWAQQSKNEINNYVDSYENSNCPTECGPPADPPLAEFTAEPQFGCIPFEVEYIDLSTGSISSWEWEFPGGDPEQSTEQDPIVLYDQVGFYDAFLTVTGRGGSDTWEEFEIIEASDVPIANFDYEADEREVEFENTSERGEFFFWDFGDGNTSTIENPIHTYDQDGFYTVLLEVENDCGGDIIEKEIEVISKVTADFTSDVVDGCPELEVQYEDLSSDNVIDWEWEFEGGIPAFSTEEDPIVLYETPGTYGVTLTVFSRQGKYQDTKSDSTYIEVFANPEASYTYVMDSMNPRRVIFTNTSQNADSYEWDFGDGNTSTEENPTHTYASDDFYFVELTAINSCDEDFYEEEIQISSKPIAGFSADPNTGCEGSSVQYTSLSSDNTESWSWEFEGGTPSTSTNENPVVQYNTPGVYNVTQYVTNVNGKDTLVEIDYIEILALPTSEFNSQRIGDGVYSFNNSSSNSNGQRWDFGDGSVSSDVNPTHSYGADGTYTVNLTTFNVCDTVTSTEDIQVLLIPEAAASSDVSNGCAQLSVQFQDISSGQVDSYLWNFEGGTPASSTDENPSVIYSNRGLFDVQLIATNASGSDTIDMVDMIEVFDIPESSFDYTQDSLDFDFTNEANFADSVHYNFGDGNESGEPNPSHSYAEAGNFMVMQVAFNNCGTDTVVQAVSVEGAEPLAIIGSSTTTICVGDTVFYTDESAGNPTSWDWTFDGGDPATSTDQNPVVVYNDPGLYDVELQVDNGFGVSSSSLVDYVQVVAEPDFDFTVNEDGLAIQVNGTFTGTIDSLEWDFGDGMESSDRNPEYEYEGEGTYTITLTVYNVCGAFTLTKEVTVMTSSLLEISSDQYKIYPNPAQNILFVESNTFNRANKIDVFMTDIFGRTLRNLKTEKNSGNQISVQLNNFATGTYMLQIEVDGKMIFDKFVISR